MRVLLTVFLFAAVSAGGEGAREDAWEAHLLGESGDASYARDLLRTLRLYRDLETSDARMVRRTILDALIRIRAKVPAGDLVPLHKRHRAPVFILLARNAQVSAPALLEIMKGDSSELEWIAAGNLLAAHPPAGFASHLLSRYLVTLHVRVRDERTPHLRACPEPAQQVIVRRRSKSGKGWPPQALYLLRSRGGTPLAAGSRTIFFVRKEHKAGQVGFSSVESVPDRASLRQEFVARLLGMKRDEMWVPAHQDIYPTWTDADALRIDVERARKAIRTNWDGLKQRLIREGRLTDAESEALALRLSTKIDDERVDKSAPLTEK